MKKPTKHAFIATILTLLIIAFFLHPTNLIYINVTSSLPQGFYLAIPTTTIRAGDIVTYTPMEDTKAFILEHGWFKTSHPETMTLMKKAALAGSVYTVEKEFIIDGTIIGPVEEISPSGVKLPRIRGTYTILEGEFLPYGTNPHSFDGRYEGTIPTSRILSRVIPVWTK